MGFLRFAEREGWVDRWADAAGSWYGPGADWDGRQ